MTASLVHRRPPRRSGDQVDLGGSHLRRRVRPHSTVVSGDTRQVIRVWDVGSRRALATWGAPRQASAILIQREAPVRIVIGMRAGRSAVATLTELQGTDGGDSQGRL